MERSQLKDVAFGLDVSQIRRLSSNDKVDAILTTKRRRSYAGARKEAQATSMASARCSIINNTLVVHAVSVAAAVLMEPQPTQPAKAAKPRPPLAQQTAARCQGSANEGSFSSSAADSLRLSTMEVGFDATTIIDLVGLIGRAVANYSGPDNYEELDVYLEQLLNTIDTGLRRALTLGVLAGAQEAARFGLMAAASSKQTSVPASSYAREQLLRLSYGYGALVGPDPNHLTGRATTLRDDNVNAQPMSSEDGVALAEPTGDLEASARPPAVDAYVFFGSSLGGSRRKATRPQHVVRPGQLDVGGDIGAGGSDTVDFFAPFSVPLEGDDHFEGGDPDRAAFRPGPARLVFQRRSDGG